MQIIDLILDVHRGQGCREYTMVGVLMAKWDSHRIGFENSALVAH